jgi:hypothetical protein
MGGLAFCSFEAGEQRRCIAAHSGSGAGPSKGYPYCERWDGELAKKSECNKGNPSFCTSQFPDGSNAWKDCLKAFMPQKPPQSSYCDIFKDTDYPGDRQRYNDCKNPMTGFCITTYEIGTNARENCCSQDGYTMSKQRECKTTPSSAWGRPDADQPAFTPTPRPSSSRPCYLGFILCKEVSLEVQLPSFGTRKASLMILHSNPT